MSGNQTTFRPSVLFLLFALFFSRVVEAGTLICRSQDNRPSALAFEDDKNGVVTLVDIVFDTGPYVSRSAGCERFLDDLAGQAVLNRTEQEFTYRELLPRLPGGAVARATGATSERLHAVCRKSAYCQVAFPYSLSSHNWTPVGRESAFPSGGAVCRAPIRERPLIQAIAKKTVEWLPTESPLKIWWNPLTRFGDEIVDLIRTVDDDFIVASTMTFSIKEVHRIHAALKKKRNLRMVMLVDASLLFSARGAPEILDLADDRLSFLPIAATERGDTPFHLKGAVAFKAKRYIFTSNNIRNNDDPELVLDFGISGKEAQVAEAWGKLLIDQIDTACRKTDFLSCLLDVRFSPGAFVANLARRNFTQSCQFADNSQSLKGTRRSAAPRYFLSAKHDDVEKEVLSFIRSAKQSVGIAAHQIKHPEILRALLEKTREKVAVTIAIGENDDMAVLNEAGLGPYVIAPPKDRSFVAHAKGIVVDGKRILFGTGNFTLTALKNEREAYLISENPDLVTFWNRYLRTVAMVAGRKLPEREIASQFTEALELVWDRDPNRAKKGKRAVSHRGDLVWGRGKSSEETLFRMPDSD